MEVVVGLEKGHTKVACALVVKVLAFLRLLGIVVAWRVESTGARMFHRVFEITETPATIELDEIFGFAIPESLLTRRLRCKVSQVSGRIGNLVRRHASRLVLASGAYRPKFRDYYREAGCPEQQPSLRMAASHAALTVTDAACMALTPRRRIGPRAADAH